MRTIQHEVDHMPKEKLLLEYEKIVNRKTFLSRKYRELIIARVNKYYKGEIMGGNINVLKAGILKEISKNPGKKMMAVISDPVYTELALLSMNGNKEIHVQGDDLYLNETLLIRFTAARETMQIPENVTDTMFFVTEVK